MTLIPVFIRVRYFTDEQKKPQKNTHSVFVNGAVKEHKKNTCALEQSVHVNGASEQSVYVNGALEQSVYVNGVLN